MLLLCVCYNCCVCLFFLDIWSWTINYTGHQVSSGLILRSIRKFIWTFISWLLSTPHIHSDFLSSYRQLIWTMQWMFWLIPIDVLISDVTRLLEVMLSRQVIYESDVLGSCWIFRTALFRLVNKVGKWCSKLFLMSLSMESTNETLTPICCWCLLCEVMQIVPGLPVIRMSATIDIAMF